MDERRLPIFTVIGQYIYLFFRWCQKQHISNFDILLTLPKMSEEESKGRVGLRELPHRDYNKLHPGEPAVFLEKASDDRLKDIL